MKKILSFVTIAVAALSLSACSGFLEKQPILSQSTELTLSSYAGLNSATLGAYSYFANTTWYGGERLLNAEMRSGNGMKSLDHTSNRYITDMNWNYTSDATNDLWAYCYFAISRANNVINNLEGKETPDVTKQDLNNLKAECLFIRALSHFDCVLLYAQPYTYKNGENPGVPVVLVTDPSGKPARKTVKEVYAQIVKDLTEAESIIDPKYTRDGVSDDKAVVSIGAIRALLSRVYLYMGEWQKSADYATKVIDSDKYKMYTAEEYGTVWTQDVGGSEVIFEVYIDINNYSNLNPSYMTYPGGAYGDCLCSLELYNLYEEGDVRKALYTQDSEGRDNQYWTLKYAGKGLNTPDANNTVVLRLSEMYLNRAEAAVKGATTGSTAEKDLNMITSNRNAAAYTSVAMGDIQNERRKELAWEGHYLYDCGRWGKAIKRTADAFVTEKNANIDFPSYRWALPIAKRELEVNENLVQNEGYN